MANVQQTYDCLACLMTREQYLSVRPPDLALFLKERATTDIEELAKLAEQYCEAHQENATLKKNYSDHRFKPKDTSFSSKKCHRCGSSTHLIKDCTVKTEESKTPQNNL